MADESSSEIDSKVIGLSVGLGLTLMIVVVVVILFYVVYSKKYR